ncbi:MAG TPA: YebC/PmpR family DNA-binding transcriptional regulator [Gammaproteobacteria bacterium]|nr:YebC/PmpR family DNA-binding transcriptional regulator [Gammaproteobacteria bacterium]
MAGHSKWANIKRHKAKQDAKRGKLYTKLIRELTVAAKQGGGDASANPRLRLALERALMANMSKDVIDRAIKRGAGGMEGEQVDEVRYEGYGPGGTAVMVDCMTNNRNRTVAEVRHAFTKNGGNLGTDGSVSYLFKKLGEIAFAPGVDEERLMEHALELGADDILTADDGSMEVLTSPEAFLSVKEGLEKAGFKPDSAEVTMRASTNVDVSDLETAEKVVNLIDMLEDLDDVQLVYSNANIEASVLNQLA